MATAYGTGAHLIFLFNLIKVAFAQINYSISEELEIGAVVGNITNDLVMDVRELLVRNPQLILRGGNQYFQVNTQSGILFVNERIDREQLCKEVSTCSIRFDLAMVNPDEVFPVEVTILDKNDNAPIFPTDVISLQLSELLTPGARFPLESAHDPDVGLNSVANYHLSLNDFFNLEVQTRKGGRKIAELILQKRLDRETIPYFQLVLTAVDGGSPHRSGTTQIVITVTDINDNAPVFDQEIYKTRVLENSPVGTLLIKLHANDLDEGLNAEFKYSFSNYASPNVRELFILNAETGEIKVNGLLDFETTFDYELDVQAVDNLPNVGHAKVLVTVVDANDNAPNIKFTSVKNLISENTTLGSVIAVFEVTDIDTGENGLVQCQIPDNIPFNIETILSNRYTIITAKKLDREEISQYNISISAWDAGSPSLTTVKTISVSVSDINDNAPQFVQSSYDVYLMENNVPGRSIFSVTALDPDLENNGDVSYSILENKPQTLPMPFSFSVSWKSGSIFALRSFDYEQVKTFQITILARDAGSPSLSNTAIVRIIILDQNDNPPIVISPPAWNSSVAFSIVPHSIFPNSLVTKVIANDEDSGQNARLSFEIIEATDLGLFVVGLHTGEIRTTRSFIADDSTIQNLVVLVKDSGQPSLSTSVTICLSITVNSSENPSERANNQTNAAYFSDLNIYLIFLFGSTSLIFLLIIILLVVFKCRQNRNNSIYQNSAACCCCTQRDSNVVFSRRSVVTESQNYYKAGQMLANSDPYHYTVRLSPASSKSDFLFLSTCQPTLPLNDISVDDVVVK